MDAGGGDTGAAPDVAPIIDVRPIDVGSPPASCGASQADLSSITSARGIGVDVDGTVYFTREMGTQSWIGRLRPGQLVEPSWYPLLSDNAQPRVLRVDSVRRLIYVACTGMNAVHVIKIDSRSPGGTVAPLPAAHGLTIADDGYVFVSTSDGFIHRLRLDLAGGFKTQATDIAVFPPGQRPMGLAYLPSGHVFVGSNNGGIKRLRVLGGKLVEPSDYGSFAGAANDLAFDVEGRLFIADQAGATSKPLVQIPPGGVGLFPSPGGGSPGRAGIWPWRARLSRPLRHRRCWDRPALAVGPAGAGCVLAIVRSEKAKGGPADWPDRPRRLIGAELRHAGAAPGPADRHTRCCSRTD